MKFPKCVLPVLLLSGLGYTSVLGDLAAAIPARTFVKVPANASLQGMDMVYSLFYYNDSGCWDPVNKRIRWLGAGGTCCTNGQFYLVTYTEADNTWAIEKAPWTNSGHGFDGNTMNPANADHYFAMFSSKTVHRINGPYGTYSRLPDIPYAEVATVALAWFPELNNGLGGLVHVSGSGNLSWYTGVFNGNKWTVIPRPSTSWGSYAPFAEYSPARKLVLLGGGHGSRVIYTLDAQLNLTRMPDTPFEMRPNESLCAADPVSGDFIITDLSSNTWRELDPVAGKWTALNLSNKPPHPVFQVPIPEYNVILYISRPDAATREVYLYRHNEGTAVQQAPPEHESSFQISATPNPFQSKVVINVRGRKPEARGQKVMVQVYDISGKTVFKLASGLWSLASGISWNASGLPAGVYMVKATAGREQVTKKLYLMK